MGGTDDTSNLVKLTVEEHAEAHRKLYEEHGKIEDKLAWLGLSGQIGKDEILKKIYSENAKKMVTKRKDWSPWNKGKTNVYSQETINKMKTPKSKEHLEKLKKPKSNTERMGRYERTDEIKKKLSERSKSETKISCPICEKLIRPCNLKIHIGSKKCLINKK
jgi:hypothetical protein